MVSIQTIPAGCYVVAAISCHNAQVLSAWDWLCSNWRESRAEPYEQRWNYEVFHHSLDGTLNPKRGMEVCLRLSD